uniref:O-acyltransferase n=4 Tax=Hirondellea gigas TaxID=1518452 RepID=A0A6A7FZM9_9CRUS
MEEISTSEAQYKAHEQLSTTASEERLLQEIHFRNLIKELKEGVQEEVNAVLDKKFSAWQSSVSCELPDSKSSSRCRCSHAGCCQQATKESSQGVSSDDWSPGFSRALHQLDSTNTLTKALTRSHSKIGRGGGPGSRVFVARPSLLTELLQVSHICSLYNVFVAILFLLLGHELLDEIITTGSVNLELSMMMWCFGKMDSVILIWLGMFVVNSVGVYAALHCWAHNRHRNTRVFDNVFGSLFLVYLILLLYLPSSYLLHYDLPPASSFIVLAEQVRFLMKSWAFVRSNIWRAMQLSGDELHKKTDGDALNQPTTLHKCPDFSKHLYFLFAPTLVYRDEYPRSASINWGNVVSDLAQVVGCIFYTHFLLVRFCAPVFHKYGTNQTFSASQMLMSVFSCCFPASLVLLCAFFAVLHAWLNAFAEMMKFSDRMFYKDWWNSTSYSRFYRTWNCVVHDWLYEYVYMELHASKSASRLQRYLPLLVVFLISSVVHEYMLALAFRFFYPVLLLMFGGFGVVFMFIKTRASQFNVCLWLSLILGTGIMMCLYSLEWYARRNCAPLTDGFADYLVPRSWFCESL